MSKKIGGLGKGLGAFGLGAINKPKAPIAKAKPQQEATVEGLPVQELDISKITANPGQPRQEFDPDALKTLQESITQYGVLQPILVRKTVKGYELIAGERRFRAATQAGLKTIPALVREYNDAQMSEVALIENIQRENLNAIEEACEGVRVFSRSHPVVGREGAVSAERGLVVRRRLRHVEVALGVGIHTIVRHVASTVRIGGGKPAVDADDRILGKRGVREHHLVVVL